MKLLKICVALITSLSYQLVWAGQLLGAREYDGLGNVKAEISNDLSVKNYRYSNSDMSSGRVTDYIDPNNNVYTFQYNESTGALLQDVVIDKETNKSDIKKYSYDRATDNLIGVENFNYIINYDYYPHEGPLRSIEYKNKNDSNDKGYKVEALYDQNGTLIGAKDSLNFTEGLEYDSQGKLLKYSYSNGKTIINAMSYGYDSFNRVSQIQVPNNNNAFYEYNSEGRVSSLIIGTAKDHYLMKYGYEYSTTGNLLEVRLFAKEKGSQGYNINQEHNVLIKYDYDNLNHLIEYNVSNVDSSLNDPYLFPRGPANSVVTGQKYYYTANSSLARIDTFVLDIYKSSSLFDVATFTFDESNGNSDRATSVFHSNTSLMSDVGASSNAYDKNGNLIQDQKGNSYTYNARNEMVSLNSSFSKTNYDYYPTGKLAKEQSTSNRSSVSPLDGVPVQYYYNSNSQVILQKQGDSYKRILNDNIIISKNSDGEEKTTYQYKDLQGSVVALSENENSSLTHQYVYTPYGVQTDTFDQNKSFPYYKSVYDISENNIGYTGQSYNSSSGIMMMGGYRGYDPLVGSFLKQDSYTAFDGVANRYAYANGNPIFYVDPSGHFSMPAWFSGALTIALSVGMMALGVGLAVFTGGASTPLAILGLSLMVSSSAFGAATGALNIAQEYTSGQTREALYWASVGTGVASFVLSAAAGGVNILSSSAAAAAAASSAGGSIGGAAVAAANSAAGAGAVARASAGLGGAAVAAANAPVAGAAAVASQAGNSMKAFMMASFIVGKSADAAHMTLSIVMNNIEDEKAKTGLSWAVFGLSILSAVASLGVDSGNALTSDEPLTRTFGMTKVAIQSAKLVVNSTGTALRQAGYDFDDDDETLSDADTKLSFLLTALGQAADVLHAAASTNSMFIKAPQSRSVGAVGAGVLVMHNLVNRESGSADFSSVLRDLMKKYGFDSLNSLSVIQQGMIKDSVFLHTF